MRSFLQDLMDDPQIMLDYVMDINQAREFFKVDGPFDFIIESKLPISFGSNWMGIQYGEQDCGRPQDRSGYAWWKPKSIRGNEFCRLRARYQGGCCNRTRPMIDEAPTIARMLGFEMFDTDGSVIAELLRVSE